MVVYKATNRLNGNAYIGITKQPLRARMTQHKSAAALGSRTTFANAIRKYGFDAFDWQVLYECDNRTDLEAAEVRLIAEHGTRSTGRHGYNRTDGGAGTGGMSPTQETRDKLKRSSWVAAAKRHGIKRQPRLFHPNLGLRASEESKRKMSESQARRPIESWPRKLERDQWGEISRRREAGESFRAIGEAYGVRPETVFYFCKRNRVQLG